MSVEVMGSSGGRTPALGQVPQTAAQNVACSGASAAAAGHGLAIPNHAPTTAGVGGVVAFFANAVFGTLNKRNRVAAMTTASPVKSDLRNFMDSSSPARSPLKNVRMETG